MSDRPTGHATARSRFEQFSNVETLDQTIELGLYWIEKGTSTVSLVYAGDPPQTLDFTFLLTLPHLCDPILEILGTWGTENGKSRMTRLNARDHLKTGFYRFLVDTQNLDLTLEGLTSSLVHKFSLWLDERLNPKEKPLAVGTKRQYRECIVQIVNLLKEDDRYSERLSDDFNPGESPWQNRQLFVTPTRCLTDVEQDALLTLCAREMKRTMDKVLGYRSAIEQVTLTRDELNALTSRQFAKDFTLCLAAIDANYPGIVPPLDAIFQRHRDLCNACTKIIYRDHTQEVRDTTICFQPNLDDLVPFILFLALRTGFNTSVVLGLRTNEIKTSNLFGKPRVQIQGMKERGETLQRKSFPVTDHPLDAASVIQFLLDWSARVRPHIEEGTNTFLFLYVSARDFTPADFHLKPTAWMKAFKAFRKRHNLEPFGLREIRQTYLEKVRMVFGDSLLHVKVAAGHKNIQTQLTHYNNDAMKQRQSEQIGLLISLQDRWVGSQGLIDPTALWTGHQDVGAATLGFACLDPYQSPQPGQAEGRLCDAYGACVTCPLAVINPRNPRTLVRLLQLKGSIEDAQTTLDARRWLTVWAPRLEQLNTFWLAAISDPQTIEVASTLFVPPLPPLRAML